MEDEKVIRVEHILEKPINELTTAIHRLNFSVEALIEVMDCWIDKDNSEDELDD